MMLLYCVIDLCVGDDDTYRCNCFQVFAWGLGRAGQLGDGCIGREASPCPSPGLVLLKHQATSKNCDEASVVCDELNGGQGEVAATHTQQPSAVGVVCGWEHSAAICNSGQVC